MPMPSTPPWAGLTSAGLPSGVLGGRSGWAAETLWGCSLYTCSHQACLQLEAAAVPRPSPLPDTPTWHWPPPGARWHLARPYHTGLGSRAFSHAGFPEPGVGVQRQDGVSVCHTEVPPCLLASRGEGVWQSQRWPAGLTRVPLGCRRASTSKEVAEDPGQRGCL